MTQKAATMAAFFFCSLATPALADASSFVSSVGLGDRGACRGVSQLLRDASLDDRDAREIAAIMAAQLNGLLQVVRGATAAGLAELARSGAPFLSAIPLL